MTDEVVKLAYMLKEEFEIHVTFFLIYLLDVMLIIYSSKSLLYTTVRVCVDIRSLPSCY